MATGPRTPDKRGVYAMWPSSDVINTRTDAPRFPVVTVRPGADRIYFRLRHRMSELMLGEALALGLDIAQLLHEAGVPVLDRSALDVVMARQLEYPGGRWEIAPHGAIAV